MRETTSKTGTQAQQENRTGRAFFDAAAALAALPAGAEAGGAVTGGAGTGAGGAGAGAGRGGAGARAFAAERLLCFCKLINQHRSIPDSCERKNSTETNRRDDWTRH